jgi:glycosyltransferase involved in cell wall biosynthesis
MKILTLATDFPYPPDSGTAILAFERIRELSRRHDVTVLCIARAPISRDRIREMERYARCIVVQVPPIPVRNTLTKGWQLARSLWRREPYFVTQGIAAEGLRAVEREAAAIDADIIDADSAAVPYLRARVKAPTVAIMHNLLESAIRHDLAVATTTADKCTRLAQLVLMMWFEEQIVRSFDLCVAVTAEQAYTFQKLHPRARVRHCLSVGIDFDFWTYAEPADRATGACFLGKMDYAPNVEAVLWFYRQVLPLVRQTLPDFRFSIVGSNPDPAIQALASDPAIEVTGYVDDVRPWVQRAGVMVLPMKSGGGILNKLLQALALGVPTVATRLALEGTTAVHERDVLVAESAEEVAEAVVRIATDAALRHRLSAAGRTYVEQSHQWSVLVRRYEAELEAIVEKRRDDRARAAAPTVTPAPLSPAR